MLCPGDFFVKRVRVLVANHPRLMRELVMATIADQPDIEVVGEVQNENDLADIVEQVQPDVLIIAMDERAFNITRFGLKRHVGKQDEYAAAFGGLNYMRFSRDGATQVEPLHLDPGVLTALQANLMLFFTGAAHHSWDILADQEKSTRLPEGSAVEALHQVKEAAALMKEALLCGDLEHFGHLLDDAWQAKKRISQRISSPRIDHLYGVARESGALGGKITGAGGGGFLLLYSEPASQDAVRAAMQCEGVQEMAFAFDSQGAQVIVNDPFIDHDEHAGTRWTFLPMSSAAAV
jgi:galactokinase/mevalonate kinase-like predicted kinase